MRPSPPGELGSALEGGTSRSKGLEAGQAQGSRKRKEAKVTKNGRAGKRAGSQIVQDVIGLGKEFEFYSECSRKTTKDLCKRNDVARCCSLLFKKLWQNIRNIKFTVVTIF